MLTYFFIYIYAYINKEFSLSSHSEFKVENFKLASSMKCYIYMYLETNYLSLAMIIGFIQRKCSSQNHKYFLVVYTKYYVNIKCRRYQKVFLPKSNLNYISTSTFYVNVIFISFRIRNQNYSTQATRQVLIHIYNISKDKSSKKSWMNQQIRKTLYCNYQH